MITALGWGILAFTTTLISLGMTIGFTEDKVVTIISFLNGLAVFLIVLGGK